MISQPRSLLLGLSLVLAACGGEGLTLPPDGAAAAIEVTSGNGQSGRVGSTLAESLVVKVTDTQDRPVAGAEVVFEFTADGSTASPARVSTDANGIAWSRLGLGTRVGPVGGTVSVPVGAGVTPVQAAITATALPGDANGIAEVSGNGQSAPVNSALPAPLVVRVTDQVNNPISGVPISWTFTGGGSVSSSATVTGDDGLASVTRTLGPTAGQQTTVATATGLDGSPLTFTHTATAGTATGVVKVSGDGQSGLTGTELAQPLVVQVLDAQSNPIANRAVAWLPGAGDGSVNPQTSNTDGQGLASTRWTLGSAGSNTVSAVVSGLAPATFTATATAGGPSGSRSRVDVQPTRIPAGGSSSITVRVRDGSGNRLAGVPVSATSSGSGNEISPASATTGDDGVATFSFRSTVAEEKTITVVAGGVTLDDHPVITVIQLSSTTEITDVQPEPSTSGQQITVTFAVTGEGGGTPTGMVTIFSLEETGGCDVPVGQGSCSFTLDVATTHHLRATYSGDAQFEDSSDPDGQDHVVLPVIPTNQAPVANSDPSPTDAPYTTPGGGAALGVSSADGVLKNDTDPDGDVLTAGSASTPGQGSVLLNADGSFTYTPNAGAAGTDTFTYEASDGVLSSTATVTITIAP